MFKRINEGECDPSVWWGFCWLDSYRRQATIAPIGLNVIAASLRFVWLWVHHGATSWLERNEPKRGANVR